MVVTMTDRLCSDCNRFYNLCNCDEETDCLAGKFSLLYDNGQSEEVYCWCRDCSTKFINELRQIKDK